MLDGKVAIVTGGAQGIGKAIAARLSAEGAIVVLADIDGQAAERAAQDLPGPAGGRPCDVSDESDVASLFEKVLERHGRLDILVNNAGITRDSIMHRMTLTQFREVIEVHLQGTWLCTREAIRHMREREGGGTIINMSSISGKIGNLGQTNYSAAKAGIVGMTKAAAKEGARFDIRVNAIQPGLIRTAMTEAMPEDAWDEKMENIPLGRAGTPSEVADVALFLASELSSYVTGAVIEIAGGRAM